MALLRNESEIAELDKWEVLKVALKTHNLELAMQAFGLGEQPEGIKKVHIPQTTAVRNQGISIVGR